MTRRITVIIVWVLCFQSSEAQKYTSRQLEYLAGLVKCPFPVNSGEFRCPEVSSLPLKVEYDTDGIICHLGFSLFVDSLKNTNLTKSLYNFQERLFLEVFLQSDEAKAKKLLNEYKVQWTDNTPTLGTKAFYNLLENSLRLASKDSVEYVLMKDSLTWTSSWQDANSSFVLRFPANFDLITGMDKKEAEIQLAKHLQTFQCKGIKIHPVSVEASDLQQLSQSVYILTGKYFLTQGMNGNLFFKQTDSATFQLLYDRSFPVETIVNLFNRPDMQRTNDCGLQIKQIDFGSESLFYSIKLSDFQCFMGDDFEIFTGIEKCTDDVAEFSVIYKSKWYNYNHLLYVQTTPQNLFDKTEPMKAMFYTFIPNHNIKNLYKEYIDNPNYSITIK